MQAEGNAFGNLRFNFWSKLNFWNSFALKFAAVLAMSSCPSWRTLWRLL